MLELRDHDDLLGSASPDLKCQSRHINGNHRGFVVRKLKSMDWVRIHMLLDVSTRTLIAPARSIHCFALRNTDYCTTSIGDGVHDVLTDETGNTSECRSLRVSGGRDWSLAALKRGRARYKQKEIE
jgi:hypothetical protein